METTGCMECFCEMDNEKFNRIRENLKSAISEIGVPHGYTVNIYSDPLHFITFEASGPNEKRIKTIDLKLMSKLIEICEKEKLGPRFCGPCEIIPGTSDKISIEREIVDGNQPLEALVNDLVAENKTLKNRFRHVEKEIAKIKAK